MIVKFKLFEGKYLKEDPLYIYSLGDRVIFKTTHFKGREGTIISFFKGDYSNELLVKLDTKEKGDDDYFCKGDNNEDPEGRSYYTFYDKVELVEQNIPVRVRWYKKGKLEEGIRWYKNGKLDKLEFKNEPDCNHEWVLQQKRMLNTETYSTYMKYWKECRLCGAKKDIEKPKIKTSKSLWVFDNYD